MLDNIVLWVVIVFRWEAIQVCMNVRWNRLYLGLISEDEM